MAHEKEFEVHVGKHKLSIDPTNTAEHWAVGIKYDETYHWYEVAGVSKNDTGAENKINIHTDSTKYTTVIFKCKRKYSAEKPIEQFLQEWFDKWISEHPIYRINGDNCQKLVKDFLHFVDYEDEVETQNQAIGNRAIGAGIGAIVVGICAVAAGLLIKGDH